MDGALKKQVSKVQSEIKAGTAHFKFPAHADYLAIVRSLLQGIATRMGFESDDIDDLKIAVTEACRNCIHHAYPRGRVQPMEVIFDIKADCLMVFIKDWGRGFNTKSMLMKLQSDFYQKELGEKNTGLYIVMELVDDLSLSSNAPHGTTVKLTKYIEGHGE